MLIKRAEGSGATVRCDPGRLSSPSADKTPGVRARTRARGIAASHLHSEALVFPAARHSLSVGTPVHRENLHTQQPCEKRSPFPSGTSGGRARALLTSSACPGRSMLSFPVLMSQTFSVLSLLPLTSSLLSADHATWYTDPTWPRREVRYLEVDVKIVAIVCLWRHHVAESGITRITYFPVRPSQILMDLSNEAEAMSLVSGEKSTSLTRALWPVILAKGFFSSAGFHRNMVKSSEPDTKRSAAGPCGVTMAVSALLQRSSRAHGTQHLP